jgi:protein-tyrosine phosphatase
MPTRILFVCTGNLCRSPMAASLLQHRLGDAAEVGSAGLMAVDGRPLDPVAGRVLAARGVAVPPHESRRLRLADLERAELVLAMEQRQIAALRALAPDARARTFLLGKWHGDIEIPDPYGRDDRAFDQCCALMDDAIEQWIARSITPASRRADVHEHSRSM